jgi:hypothetical protein
MRAIARGAVLGAALGLTACGMGGCTDLAGFIKDSDNNPNCYRDITAKAATVFVFMWPVPILTEGSYRKVCNADKAPGASAQPPLPSFVQPLQPGMTAGGPTPPAGA